MRKFVVLALLALMITSVANAGSITTLFTAGNSGSFGGAVYFDVTVGAMPIEVTGYDTNSNEAVQFDWTVYAAPGTYAGNETNVAFWGAPVATGTGQGMGLNNPSPVTLTGTFVLDANTTYGMALVIGSNAGHDYTNGPLGPYSNADVTLTLGSASNVPFSGNIFSPRVWNGTVYYDVIPEPATLSLLALGGLALLRRR